MKNLSENASRYDHAHGDEGPDGKPARDEEPFTDDELAAARDELADEAIRREHWKLGLAMGWGGGESLAVALCHALNNRTDPDALHKLRDEAHELICDWFEAVEPMDIEAEARRMREE